MRWRYMSLLAIMALGFLGQHTRLCQLEAQLATLADSCQRQEVKLKELEAYRDPVPEEPLNVKDVIRKYAGYFDDHDVSGLLEDD